MTDPTDASYLVVGAGGIGCPAAWALVDAGVKRVRLVDPDVVELSNLPRQVLYVPADLGRPKARAAAGHLGGRRTEVEGVHARMDDRSAEALLDGIDVMIDATDGAAAKDWINQYAVRRGVPLVHAAGLRSEARLLRVPAGGRPCLACLFGRLAEETGSCADLGVWNGVVGTIGFLAADAALGLAAAPARPGAGYVILDFESTRPLVLGARPDAACPACAHPAEPEPYPREVACAAPDLSVTEESLDLREERCPMNLLRARRALADLEARAVLDIELGAEGAGTVPDGVRALGHEILESETRGDGLWLRVRASGRDLATPGERLDEHALQRFARQIVLPEVGEAGQRALIEGAVWLKGSGSAFEAAAIYLSASGVGQLGLCDPAPALLERCTARALGRVLAVAPADAIPDDALEVTADSDGPVARALALGASIADRAQRALVQPGREGPAWVLPDLGAAQ